MRVPLLEALTDMRLTKSTTAGTTSRKATDLSRSSLAATNPAATQPSTGMEDPTRPTTSAAAARDSIFQVNTAPFVDR